MEWAVTHVKRLEKDGCNVEALACRLINATNLDRKKSGGPLKSFTSVGRKRLRSLSRNLRNCAGEMSNRDISDATEAMLFMAKVPSPDLIRAFNELQMKDELHEHARSNSLFSLAIGDGTRGNFLQKLPEWMDDVAALIDGFMNESRKRRSPSFFWDWCAWIANEVKRETGREHYEEVSGLLDGLLAAKNQAPIGTETFKKNISRFRKYRSSRLSRS